jgi:DGQHR domain-containing protein
VTGCSKIKRRALQVTQVADAPIYLFTLTASEILRLADISRISRDQQGDLIGYQRQEVRNHVGEIATYLNGDHPLFPHPLILALSSEATFKIQRGPKGRDDDLAIPGFMEIPLPRDERAARPAWIVDGQQRALALAQAENGKFPIPVSAFISDSVTLQRDQFVRVNSARPLPRGLVDELLPQLESPLPAHLARSQFPSILVDALNTDGRSPFRSLIRRESLRGSLAHRGAVVTDKSLSEWIKESLNRGYLGLYRAPSNRFDREAIWEALLLYWCAVEEVFDDAWNRPASESRLMHGVGIRSMGRLMDRMMGSIRLSDPRAPSMVRAHLRSMAPYCHWTSGRWEERDRAWDDLQNTPQDINLLSHHLGRLYVLGSA